RAHARELSKLLRAYDTLAARGCAPVPGPRIPRGRGAMSSPSARNEALVEHALWGLSQRPRQLSPRYLYDARGSTLFDRITGLEAYYPTRTEMSILRSHARDIAGFVRPGSV